MATAGKYNLYNLMGAQPEETLKNILAKVDIDYQQHFPPGANSETKEAALSNILSSIQSSRKLILFKNLIESNFATDPEVIKEQNIEKNIEQIKVVSIITRKILNSLLEDALQSFLNEEWLKHVTLAISEWRRKYFNAKDERLQIIYESEIQRILTDQAFQKRLQQLNQQYQARVNQHDIKINNINDLIGNIKERKKSTINDAAIRVSDELANHKAENSDLLVYSDVIPAENRDQFMKDFLQEAYRANKQKELKNYIPPDNDDEELQRAIALDKYDQAKVKVQLHPLANYLLARNNHKSVKDLAAPEPDYEKIFIAIAKKNGGNIDLLTPEQIKAEAKLLAQKFEPALSKMINGKKEKMNLRAQCVKIEAEKQKEKVKMQTLYSKLELPSSAKITKTPASIEFDDFLSTVEITPKQPKASNK